MTTTTRRRHRAFLPSLNPLDPRCLLSGLSPVQMDHAYGVDSFHFVSSSGQTIKADGSGETIAIVDAYHDANLFNDVHTFDQKYGLPDPQMTQWHYGTQSNNVWTEEESLDVEWAHAIAPGAKLIVVEAATSSNADLMTAVAFARNQTGVVVLSMSWGAPETSNESAMDSLFTTPAGHTGITFIASTGDHGAWSGQEYPAVSPNVLAVGGTTLNVDSQGNYLGETGWSNGTTGSGGGGYSKYEARPSYQASVQPYSVRTVPDVSMDADPNTGCMVYYTVPSMGAGTWLPVGGTSASAPMWAGLIAIADQGRAVVGKSSLDGPTQTLSAIYSPTMRADFHDITQGFNGYYAGPGYDVDTGLGTPMAFSVVRDLMQVANATVRSASAALATRNATTTGQFNLDPAFLTRSPTSTAAITPAVAPLEVSPPTAHDARHRHEIHDIALSLVYDERFA